MTRVRTVADRGVSRICDVAVPDSRIADVPVAHVQGMAARVMPNTAVTQLQARHTDKPYAPDGKAAFEKSQHANPPPCFCTLRFARELYGGYHFTGIIWRF
jgi:hypothetical protein